ncbi:MAG: MFS transporter [Rhodothermales bacterium]
MRFVVLLGVVSLLADVTYEGARSITGPFLGLLGASATVVGIVAGAGELAGYALRLLSGFLADRTRRYWMFTIFGYAVNLLAVPALALAGHWPAAAALMIAERTGKAIRTPARDAMLSHATSELGHGWGFGLHEAMDQIGAVLGPLLVAGVMFFQQDAYRSAFGVLLIPALLTLAILFIARREYPQPSDLESISTHLTSEGLPVQFWWFLVGAMLLAVGFADFPLIAYHLRRAEVTGESTIPLLYAMAMGVDALAALAFGRLFDRLGPVVLAGAALSAALFSPFVFLGGFRMVVVGMLLWGVGMGAQESVLRAALAAMIPPERRGTAYGLFNGGFGLFWFLGSATLGFLYDRDVMSVVIVSVAAQVLAAAVLFLTLRDSRERRQNG